jgi:EmrB/QacA subfamily drug resistance transporter
MIGVMLAIGLASLDGNIVGPALPRIVSDLGGLAHLSWVVTAFSVASTASTPLYGRLSDQFGRRPAFFVSIALFLLGSTLCGFAATMPALIGFRALQGLGAGGLMTLAQTTVGDVVPPRDRPRYQGLFTAVFAICSVAGPLLGGIITDLLSWPWIFFVNLPVGALALFMIATALPRGAKHAVHAVDWAGFFLLIAATCLILLALSWGGVVFAWTSPAILGLLAAFTACVAVLVVVEHRAAAPALPPRLFADPAFSCAIGAITLAVTALFGALVFIPLYFQLVHGASATEAGLRTAPMMVGIIISSIGGGRIVSRTGRYRLLPIVGLTLAAITYGVLAWALGHAISANQFDIGLVCLGLGAGLIMPNMTLAVQNAVPVADLGVATATAAFFRSLGGAFGVAASGMLLNHAMAASPVAAAALHGGLDGIRTLPVLERAVALASVEHGLSLIFLAAGLCAACGLVLAARMPERALRGTTSG